MVGWLKQQVAATAEQGYPAAFDAGTDFGNEMNIGAKVQREIYAFVVENELQICNLALDVLGVVFVEAGVDVRRAECGRDPICDSHLRHRKTALERRGAIVDCWQHVTMQINHSLDSLPVALKLDTSYESSR